jgi:formate hydrogenlyase transcriptional activator
MITANYILNINMRLLTVRDRHSFQALIASLTDTIPFLSISIYTFASDEQLKLFVKSDNGSPLLSIQAPPDKYPDRKSIMASTETGAFFQVDDNQNLSKKSNVAAYVKAKSHCGIAESLYFGMKIHQQLYSLLVIDSKKSKVYSDDTIQRIRFLSHSFALATSWILLSEGSKNISAKPFAEPTVYSPAGNSPQNHLPLRNDSDFCGIVGKSEIMQEIYRLISQVACVDSTALILGETGTGKELIASAIHQLSRRKDNPMVKINCAALPSNLIESELFGHEKGSFTGALERRIGKFETADNGTLFLDEIGEMPLALQAKLLRAIQEREIERIGGVGTIKVNVRIICATNRNLQKEVAQGRFRSDLYYRLNVFPIVIRALRERQEDILPLAEHFLHHYCKAFEKDINAISKKVQNGFLVYPWPGNVRELQYLMERSVLLATGKVLSEVALPARTITRQSDKDDNSGVIKTIEENEREHILYVLKRCKGKITGPGGAATLLGVPASTFNSKAAKLGIKREKVIRREH